MPLDTHTGGDRGAWDYLDRYMRDPASAYQEWRAKGYDKSYDEYLQYMSSYESGLKNADPSGWAAHEARRQGVGFSAGELQAGRARMMPGLLAGAQRTTAANPYDVAGADRSRAAQMALADQMQAQISGPSQAGMQGQQSMGQLGQQALGASGANPANARAAMLQAANVGGQMGGAVGQARLEEVIRGQAGVGGLVGGLRGRDIRSATDRQQAGMQAQNLADQRSRFSAESGTALSDMSRGSALEMYKLLQRLRAKGKADAQESRDSALRMTGSILGGVL